MADWPGRTDDRSLVARAEDIAARLVADATKLETREDRRRRARIAALVATPEGREFLATLTDQVLRIRERRRAAQRLNALVEDLGVPSFVKGLDRLALLTASRLAPAAPVVVMPAVTWRLRREFSATVLSANPGRLSRHVRRRRAQGARLNINVLGEAILGESEAVARTNAIIDLLGRPDVDYVSVKISAICSLLDVIAYNDGTSRIVERLRQIFRAARRANPPKFVNLDMEEYRDLQLTIDAFTQALSEPAFHDLDASIALQAYLPDSNAALERVAAFARQRHQDHGSIVKVRLVKGANLAMEHVESQLRGWPQAPFTSKAGVDANFKRLLDRAIDPLNRNALRVGVASHNLFDVGWALAVREATGAPIEIEMLEGMANPQALATARMAGGILLYAPIVPRDDFASAVAYLVRRFDENTSPENFLAHLFNLTVGSPAWELERAKFEAAVSGRREPAPGSRRAVGQRRAGQGVGAAGVAGDAGGAGGAGDAGGAGGAGNGGGAGGAAAPVPGFTNPAFANTPDTDFTVKENRQWLSAGIERFRSGRPYTVSAVVDSAEVVVPMTGRGTDPSEPGVLLYRYVEASVPTIDAAIDSAKRAAVGWRQRGALGRSDCLRAAAGIMDRDRARTIAAMMHDAGKTVSEADPEVSEAVDFARYYAEQAARLETSIDAGTGAGTGTGTGASTGAGSFEPHEVVVVAPPWNFPYAIPAGGVLAALATGSAVILKPAPEAVLTAAELARHCWDGGVPRDVLQFLPCADDEAGQHLITHPLVDAIIFTGSWETARMFLGWRPSLEIHAETSGKNALVITAAADQDDAIRDLVHSAFSHSGQKCSAASLAIVEAAVYDDRRFMRRLADAVSSLRVGPAYDLATNVAPLIRPPGGALLRGLTELGPGEQWLVKPHRDKTNPNLWSPGVKTGVLPGSEFHVTELFGPVLGVMRARDLDHALALQNSTRYGLTGGVHSLDPTETRRWCAAVEVGNAYVNRVTTGAIVRRQPFGGWKQSAIGSPAKTGGPHYLSSLGRWRAGRATSLDKEMESAFETWSNLAIGEDPSALEPELNVLRLRSLRRVSLRLGALFHESSSSFELPLALAIAERLDVDLHISVTATMNNPPPGAVLEDDVSYAKRLPDLGVDRVRLCGVSGAVRLAALDFGLEVDVADLSPVGRIELLHWAHEQTVSATLHRHGNVTGPRDRLVGWSAER